jgi:hypothetical protein
MALGSSQPLKKLVPGIFLGVKSGRRVGLTTLPPSMSPMSENVGASTSCNPKGFHGLYRDKPYLSDILGPWSLGGRNFNFHTNNVWKHAPAHSLVHAKVPDSQAGSGSGNLFRTWEEMVLTYLETPNLCQDWLIQHFSMFSMFRFINPSQIFLDVNGIQERCVKYSPRQSIGIIKIMDI